MLFVTHVALRRSGEGWQIDDQTAEGLIRWCENFGWVTYAGIEATDEDVGKWSSATWVKIKDLPCADRLNIIALPRAYRVSEFAAAYNRTRKLLGDEIARSTYLCFTLGTLIGDWSVVAALEARKQRRKYAVWFDRIEHQVVQSDLPSMPFKRRIKERVSLPFMRLSHRYLTERSHLGLFQGKDCYDYFSRFTDKGFCVYDTHTKASDFIDKDLLDTKIALLRAGAPLRLCYVGRAADMKGPLDWIDTLSRLRNAGVKFEATWYGDGPMLDAMNAMISERALLAQVALPGFIAGRAAVLAAMRRADIFLFCHKTPESPRCLIEALVSGVPIVGYASAYARDLVSVEGGGDFVDVDKIQELADRLIALDGDRDSLADLVTAAARSGLKFDEQSVYRHRAELLRNNL